MGPVAHFSFVMGEKPLRSEKSQPVEARSPRAQFKERVLTKYCSLASAFREIDIDKSGVAKLSVSFEKGTLFLSSGLQHHRRASLTGSNWYLCFASPVNRSSPILLMTSA